MGRRTTGRVRAADVAAAAGVSTTAVSFVLNGRDAGNISPATRDRIIEAARELGYEPDHVARSLRRRSTSSLGLVTDAIASSPFGGRLLAAATEEAHRAAHMLLIMDVRYRLDLVPEAITALQHRQVDALIYVSMGFTVLDAAPAARIPLVLTNCTANSPEEVGVVPDDAAGAVAALEHLADLGHRRVAMLGGHHDPTRPPGEEGNVSGPIRWRAFHAAAKDRGIDARLVGEGWAIGDGYAAAIAACDVSAGRQPTALFAACDRVALGAQLALAHLGLEVPGDVSVIGFDDQEALAECTVPPLTTVALPHAAMGEAAVRLALTLADGDLPDPARLVLPCPLVVRQSTAPPP